MIGGAEEMIGGSEETIEEAKEILGGAEEAGPSAREACPASPRVWPQAELYPPQGAWLHMQGVDPLSTKTPHGTLIAMSQTLPFYKGGGGIIDEHAAPPAMG